MCRTTTKFAQKPQKIFETNLKFDVVDESGLAPESYGFCQSFLHTYSAFSLAYLRRRTGTDKGKPLKYFFKRAVKRLEKFAV